MKDEKTTRNKIYEKLESNSLILYSKNK
jgi:hypothetical protein